MQDQSRHNMHLQNMLQTLTVQFTIFHGTKNLCLITINIAFMKYMRIRNNLLHNI